MVLSITINALVRNKAAYTIPVVHDNILNLSTNENLLSHPFSDDKHINKYPNPIDSDYTSLLNSLSSYTSVDNECILITAGSGAGLKLILQTFTNNDTEILIPMPNYPGFIQDAKLSTTRITSVNVFDNNGLSPKSEFMNHIKRMNKNGSGIVYISSPNMPFGYTIDESFVDVIDKNQNILFIIDQAYSEYDISQPIDLFTKASINRKNLIVTKTLSKAFGAAGIRIGYMTTNVELIRYLHVHYCTKSVCYNSYKTARKIMEHELSSKFYTLKAKNDLDNMSNGINYIHSICNKSKQVKDVLFSDKAPFYTLRVSDASYVCKVFMRNLLLIRDKTDDIRSADVSLIDDEYVRISMSSIEVMDQIINIIKRLNHTSIHLYDTIFLDLDITLRDNYESPISGPLRKAISDIARTTKINVITDNRSKPEVITKYLKDNRISYNKLITPLTLNNIELSDDDTNNGYKIMDDCVLILKYPVITIELINHINQYKHIKVIEDSYYESSNEVSGICTDDFKIPFIGAFLETLVGCGYNCKITVIGKSDLCIDGTNVLHIGDSTNDYKFACVNGIYFKKIINPTDTLEFLNSLIQNR